MMNSSNRLINNRMNRMNNNRLMKSRMDNLNIRDSMNWD